MMIDRIATATRGLLLPLPALLAPARRAAAVGPGLVLGLALTAPGFAQGGPPDTVEAYARWAERALDQPPGGIQFLDRLEQRIFELVNERRRAAGLRPLEPSDQLRRPARAHAVGLLEQDYFAHVGPGGRNMADRVAILARRFVGRPAENLFELRGVSPPFTPEDVDRRARTVIDNLMGSAGHRANILGEAFDELAVAAAVQGNRVVVIQVFGDRIATLARPLPLTVARGTAVPLDLAAANGPAPTRYDYYRPEQRRPATMTLELDSPLTITEPGRYRLRLYVPRGGGAFDGYFGPDIVVH